MATTKKKTPTLGSTGSSLDAYAQKLYDDKCRELKLLEEKVRLQNGLPHLYGWKFYEWARKYFESKNQLTLLSAANQISKSSTQIRKHIHWATDQTIWPTLWATTPRQFWYLYPTRDVAHIEFRKKWEPEFMPRNEFKDDKIYGWKVEYYHNRIFAIHWNSGVSTFFKTYAQDVKDLQTGTCHRIDLDEEPLEDIMPELFMRLAATDGHMSAVFTPTIGQDYWAMAFEMGRKDERFPTAHKQQVSMYDCLEYEDGLPSHWTVPKIERAKAACKSDAEVQRRIYGKFVISEGLKYPSFDHKRNVKAGHPLHKDWSIWVGVDPGGGGASHPSAIAIVAVSPSFSMGRVIDGWRGDDMVTSAGDVVKMVLHMIKPYPYARIKYDWGCKDFETIAREMGLSVEPAEKSHAIGEATLNTLFKNNLLMIYGYPQLEPLVTELKTLKSATPKTKAKDDFVDALRYACSAVPWNWDVIRGEPKAEAEKPMTRFEREMADRRKIALGDYKDQGLITAEDEIEAWNQLYGITT